jgi:hypothetical protein
MRSLFLLVLSAVVAPALAARPFITDDARLTTARSCQLESWVRSYPKHREFWALPACNPTGNLEITLGGGWFRDEGAPSSHDQLFQLKTLFREFATNGWGWGLAIGKLSHPAETPGPNQLGNSYAYLPYSASFLDDKAQLHANVGWLRDSASGRDATTWGIGCEYWLNDRVSVLAESYGDSRDRPYWQAGFRTFIVPSRVQVDATIGRQSSGTREGQWFSLGIRLTPDTLF